MSVSQNFENSQLKQQLLLEMWKKKNKLFQMIHFETQLFPNRNSLFTVSLSNFSKFGAISLAY